MAKLKENIMCVNRTLESDGINYCESKRHSLYEVHLSVTFVYVYIKVSNLQHYCTSFCVDTVSFSVWMFFFGWFIVICEVKNSSLGSPSPLFSQQSMTP